MTRPILIVICSAALVGTMGHGLGVAQAQREECEKRPEAVSGANSGVTLECAQVPRRLVPADSEAATWPLGGNRFLVLWRARESGLAIWRRSGETWTRLFERRRQDFVHYQVSLGDVTGDGRTDVLATESTGGSGGCGPRVAIRVEPDLAAPLFRRYACEEESELRDGLLYFREPVGPCPDPKRSVHCHGGVRLTIRGWADDRVVVDRTVVRCFRRDLRASRGCRRR